MRFTPREKKPSIGCMRGDRLRMAGKTSAIFPKTFSPIHALSSANANKKTPWKPLWFPGRCGVPGAIRTRGLSLRRRTLYPAELRRQGNSCAAILFIMAHRRAKVKRRRQDLQNAEIFTVCTDEITIRPWRLRRCKRADEGEDGCKYFESISKQLQSV